MKPANNYKACISPTVHLTVPDEVKHFQRQSQKVQAVHEAEVLHCVYNSPGQVHACTDQPWQGTWPPSEPRRLLSDPPWRSLCPRRHHHHGLPSPRRYPQWSYALSDQHHPERQHIHDFLTQLLVTQVCKNTIFALFQLPCNFLFSSCIYLGFKVNPRSDACTSAVLTSNDHNHHLSNTAYGLPSTLLTCI